MATIKDILERNNAYSKDLEVELLRNLIDTSRGDSAAMKAKTIAECEPLLAQARAALELALPVLDENSIPIDEIDSNLPELVIAALKRNRIARDAVRKALGDGR